MFSTEQVRSIARYGTSITAGGADPLVALPSSFLLNQFTHLENIPTDPTELGPLSPVEIIVSCNIALTHHPLVTLKC